MTATAVKAKARAGSGPNARKSVGAGDRRLSVALSLPAPNMADQAIAFLETLKIPEGKMAGQPLKLAGFKRQFVCGSLGDGVMVACLSIGRGNAKTALSAGLALGALGVLLVTNRHRIGRLLRPSRGKIVAATLLTAFTPESFLRILPIPLGLSAIAVLMVFVGGRLPGPGAVVGLVGPALIHYLASCLIISGIAAHGWRVAMFMLMWPASLSAVILMRGMYVGPM